MTTTMAPKATDKNPVPYEYLCTEGHHLGSSYPIERCPACPLGEACHGELRRIGAGSRGPRA